MNKILNSFKSTGVTASQSVFWLAVIIIFALILLIVSHVVGRFFFKAPVLGAIEMAESAMVLIVFASMAYVTLQKGNVKVTLIISHFPERAQAVLNSIMSLIGAVIFAFITWQIGLSVLEAVREGLYTDTLRIPIFPLKIVATIATLIMCLELLVRFIRSLVKRGGQ